MVRPKDRAARMQIVAEMERKEKAKRLSRSVAIGLVAILVLAGAVYGISKIPGPPKTVHWHAKFEVWVNDQQLDFSAFADRSQNYDGKLYEPAHLHQPANIIHNEAKEGQGTLSKFFLYDLGGKIVNDEIVLPPGVRPVSGDFKNDGNKTLRMFLDQTPYEDQINKTAPKSAWKPVTDIPNYSFHDGDRILVIYGNYTPDRVAQIEAQFPTFNARTVT